MKLFLLLVLFIVPEGVFAQIVRRTNEDRTSSTKEVYYVLRSDKSIKEGQYSSYTLYGNTLLSEGFYKNNLKDSLWKYYSSDKKLSGLGYFKENRKVGLWTNYNYQGAVQLKYDFTDKKLLFYQPDRLDSAKVCMVINGKDTIDTVLDRKPIYLDGAASFYIILASYLRYPAMAREHNTQGEVIIAYTIDSNGHVSNHRVKKGIGSGCNEEALRVIKLITGDWLPAMLNGKPVTVEVEERVHFTISHG